MQKVTALFQQAIENRYVNEIHNNLCKLLFLYAVVDKINIDNLTVYVLLTSIFLYLARFEVDHFKQHSFLLHINAWDQTLFTYFCWKKDTMVSSGANCLQTYLTLLSYTFIIYYGNTYGR